MSSTDGPQGDTVALDRASGRPLWRQVLDDLEARLAAGELGDRFPTDRELVERYGVSRQTVREAARHLKARGVIERHRGRGSVVAGTEFLQPLGALYSLFQAVESRGIEQASEVLAQGWRRDAWAAARLGVPADEPLFHVERVRHAGGTPLALDTIWLPRDVGGVLDGVDLRRTAVYAELASRAGLVVDRGREVVSPVVPDDDLREVLAMDDGEAAMRIERAGHVGDRHVECRLTMVRGSRFALVADWPGSGVGARVDPGPTG